MDFSTLKSRFSRFALFFIPSRKTRRSSCHAVQSGVGENIIAPVVVAFITIFYPSVCALHDVRLTLVTLMFFDNSLLNFYFTDPEHPVQSTVIWRNGSTTVGPFIDINLSYINHIIEFDIASDFLIVSTDSDLIGCT
jgi:hypothetical protein